MFALLKSLLGIPDKVQDAKRLRGVRTVVRPYYTKPPKDVVLNNVRAAIYSNKLQVN